ncbi:MAG: M56 family metallopeptidase [Phycisphaerales bacterium JB039]
MHDLDLMDLLRALLPNLAGVAIITGLLGSAMLAVRWSRRDLPADRHFVLLLSLGGVGAVLLFGVALRAVIGTGWVGDSVTTGRMLRGLALLWGLGLSALALRLTLGWLQVVKLRLGADARAPQARVLAVAWRCAGEMGLRTMPTIIVSGRCASPMATGILDPAVILPASMEQADELELQLVLRHELAHIARRDCLAELLVQLVGGLLWWNPLYWMVAGRVRVLREMACDQIAAFGCRSQHRYAQLLVQFATRGRLPFGPGFSAVRMADRRSLHARVDYLVGDGAPKGLRLSRFLPNTMSNLETAGFMLCAVLVMVSLDAMMLTMLEEICAEVEPWSASGLPAR